MAINLLLAAGSTESLVSVTVLWDSVDPSGPQRSPISTRAVSEHMVGGKDEFPNSAP